MSVECQPKPRAAAQEPSQLRLTRHELVAYLEDLRAVARGIEFNLDSLLHSSAIDYKLDWPQNQRLTREYFIELTRLMRAVESHVNSTESPFDYG